MYYQIVETMGNTVDASNKARGDVSNIAESLGFKSLYVRVPGFSKKILPKIISKAFFLFHLILVCIKLEKGSILLTQVPCINCAVISQYLLKKVCGLKKIRTVAFVHDVNEIRNPSKKMANESFKKLLLNMEIIVAHNESMIDYLCDWGIKREKIINLQIFDYILRYDGAVTPEFEKSIAVAGNLANDKSTYIDSLIELKNIRVNLYGPNYKDKGMNENIVYHGVFKSDELPQVLNSGFGLVWDGTSVETCEGAYGQYLKYNNPHKLSLYIAAGIPVVIWKDAAEAYFVKENHLGILVDSLFDLNEQFEKLTKEMYEEYCESVSIVRSRLIKGYYARNALERARSLCQKT